MKQLNWKQHQDTLSPSPEASPDVEPFMGTQRSAFDVQGPKGNRSKWRQMRRTGQGFHRQKSFYWLHWIQSDGDDIGSLCYDIGANVAVHLVLAGIAGTDNGKSRGGGAGLGGGN